MKVKIEETGEINNLEKRDANGIDWAADFVGNNVSLEFDDDGIAIMSREDYNWWVETIAAHDKAEAEIAKYVTRFGADAVEEALSRSHALDYDLGDQPKMVHQALVEWLDAE